MKRKITSPTRTQIQLSLFEILSCSENGITPNEAYEGIAKKLNLSSQAIKKEEVDKNGKKYNTYKRDVRWAKQTAVLRSLIYSPKRGTWSLTDKGQESLSKAINHTKLLVYSLNEGFALWASAEDAASIINEKSIKLIFCSPPYPGKTRSYGRMEVPEWLEWMDHLVSLWKNLLTDDGTLALNLMDTYLPGSPSLIPYIERLTLNLVDKHELFLSDKNIWHAPNKLANIHWTLKERSRPKNSIEHIILFSKIKNPDWNIDRIPQEYIKKGSKFDKRDKIEIRPSGYKIDPKRFKSDGPQIPQNLIIAGTAPGNDYYSRRCKETGIIRHPARFPEALPRRIISLTTRPLDICYDPMAGSNTTGKAALDLGRRFIASDIHLEYLTGSAIRFENNESFKNHLI